MMMMMMMMMMYQQALLSPVRFLLCIHSTFFCSLIVFLRKNIFLQLYYSLYGSITDHKDINTKKWNIRFFFDKFTLTVMSCFLLTKLNIFQTKKNIFTYFNSLGVQAKKSWSKSSPSSAVKPPSYQFITIAWSRGIYRPAGRTYLLNAPEDPE